MDTLSLKIAEMKQRRDDVNKTLVEHELVKSRTDIQRFMHNAHIARFPPLRDNTPEAMYFNPPECQEANATTIRHLFNLGDVALLVLRQLGPCELAILVRVARDFRPLVTNAFIVLSNDLLTSYMVGAASNITGAKISIKFADTPSHAVNMAAIKYANLPVDRRPPVEELLSLWYHALLVTRMHAMVMSHKRDRPCFIPYAFAYHAESGRLVRLGDLNLYSITDREDVLRGVSYRLNQKPGKYHCDTGLDTRLPYCRYGDLCKMSMERLEDIMVPAETHIFSKDSITPFTKSGYEVYYCDPFYVAPESKKYFKGTGHKVHHNGDIRRFDGKLTPGSMPSNRSPFFDHYAMRIHINGAPRVVYKQNLGSHLKEVNQLLDTLLI